MLYLYVSLATVVSCLALVWDGLVTGQPPSLILTYVAGGLIVAWIEGGVLASTPQA